MAIGRQRRPSPLPRAVAALLALVAAGVALWWLRRSRRGGERSDRMAKNADRRWSHRVVAEVGREKRVQVRRRRVTERKGRCPGGCFRR